MGSQRTINHRCLRQASAPGSPRVGPEGGGSPAARVSRYAFATDAMGYRFYPLMSGGSGTPRVPGDLVRAPFVPVPPGTLGEPPALGGQKSRWRFAVGRFGGRGCLRRIVEVRVEPVLSRSVGLTTESDGLCFEGVSLTGAVPGALGVTSHPVSLA
jgi:hypothetical protein